MSDSVEGLIDVPREFVKEGVQFMNKCQKREFLQTIMGYEQWELLAMMD